MNEQQTNYNTYNNVYAPQPESMWTPVKPKRTYTPTDRTFAVTALVIGFLLVKTFEKSVESGVGFGLASTLMSVAVTVFSMLYSRRLGLTGSRSTRIIFIINIILSLSFITCDNYSVVMLNIMMIFLGNAYYCYASYTEHGRSVLNNAVRSLLSPFSEYGSMMGAIFSKKSGSEKSVNTAEIKKLLPIILGVALSLPVCAVVFILLESADSMLGEIFTLPELHIDKFIYDVVIPNVFMLLFSLPLGMYIFGAVYSRAYRRDHEKELETSPTLSVRILPPSMCAAFLAPLMVIYIVFTGLQALHLFSAGVLSSPDFSYSEYARSGFFQLCAVTVINLAVISVVMFCSKQQGLPHILRAFVIVFSLLTHCLVVTAMVKMFMYIGIYGMTPKRVQTSVFMAYLFVMFIVLIVKQFRPKLSFTRIAYCFAALVLIVMSVVPVDSLILKYNIRGFMNDKLPWGGISAIYLLDASALPELMRLTEDPEFNDKLSSLNEVSDYYSPTEAFWKAVYGKAEEYSYMTFWDWNIPRAAANRASSGE